MSRTLVAALLLVVATATRSPLAAAGGVECMEAPSGSNNASSRCVNCLARRGINGSAGDHKVDWNIGCSEEGRREQKPLTTDVCILRSERCGLRRPPPQLQQLPCVQHLFLRDNALHDLGALERLPELHVLDVSGNRELGPLVGDSSATLLRNAALRSLNLSSCQVLFVTAGAFEGVPNLQVLFLRANGLRFLSPEALRPLAQLELLDLSENPLALPPLLPPQAPVRCLLAVRTVAFEGRGAARRSLAALRLRGHATLALSSDAFRQCAGRKGSGQCSSQSTFFKMSVAQWQLLCGACESDSPSTVLSLFPSTHLLSASPTPSPKTSATAGAPTPPFETAVASANAGVVVLGTVMATLVVVQSVFIVLLLLSRRQCSVPRFKHVIALDSQEVTHTLERDQREKLQRRLGDSNSQHLYSSLNPVYETIAE